MKVERLGEYGPSDFDPKVSGENITPTAKKATAVKNRVIQAISPILVESLVKKMGSLFFTYTSSSLMAGWLLVGWSNFHGFERIWLYWTYQITIVLL